MWHFGWYRYPLSSQGEYGAAAWCHEASTDLRTFNWTTWPIGSSEIVVFGVVLSRLILDTTLIEIWLSSFVWWQVSCRSERNLWEKSMILRSLRTRLLLIGQVEPTKLQEGTYLQTPYNPKPKAACVTYLPSTWTTWRVLLSNNMISLQDLFTIIIQ